MKLLGSALPRSLEDPVATNASNAVTGFLNMLVAARDAGVRRFVYAASSSTYGDHPSLPKIRGSHRTSALTVRRIEVCQRALCRCVHALLRTPNHRPPVLQRLWSPAGLKRCLRGCLLPRWISALLRGETVSIFGTGETSRDFCYIENVVQANLLAATVGHDDAIGQIYNIAVGEATTLSQLFLLVRDGLSIRHSRVRAAAPLHREFRAGDVLHSRADIVKATLALLGYAPTHSLSRGLNEALPWFERHNGS